MPNSFCFFRTDTMEHRVSALVDFYRHVQAERMQGIPILNPALCV